MLIAWKDERALGIEALDSGHRLVIDAINRLSQAGEPGRSDAVVAEMLPLLQDRLARQFEHEHALMARADAPDRAGHEAEHRRLLNGLAIMRDSHRRGADVAGMLQLNLVCFLVSHLRGSDLETFGTGRMCRAA